MGNQESGSKKGFAAALGLASTWFGLHCGGGFATGAQGVLYFTQYGAWELVTTLIAAALMAVYAYVLWDYARVSGNFTYRSVYESIYHPYDKIFANLHEIMYLIILVMAMGGVFSGAAEVFTHAFGTPYIVGAIVISVIVFTLTIFGSEFLFKFSSTLSVILISILVILSIAGIANSPDKIKDIITNWDTGGATFWDALKPAIIYASFQATVLVGTVSVAGEVDNSKDMRTAGLLGFVLNFAMMIFMSTMLLGYYPEVIGREVPVLYVLDQIGSPILRIGYYMALYIACITTGITLVYSLVARFERYGANIIPEIEVRRRVISIAIIFICFLISLVGLLAIIGKGYSLVGYIALPVVYIPTLIIAPIKKRRILAERGEN